MIAKENECLKDYTTYRIGGNADLMIMPENESELAEALCLYNHLPIFVLGNGSNVLVADNGFRGCVIKPMFREMKIIGNEMIVQAGALVQDMLAFARVHRKMNVEILAGVPGSLGGVIAMNAGFTKAVSTIVDSVRVMDYNGNVTELSNDQMQFGYRTSIVQKEKLIVLSAKLRMVEGDNRLVVSQYLERRRKTQPIYYASCGSVFRKNNLSRFQGLAKGGAKVIGSYIVNVGTATASDVLWLIDEIVKASDIAPELEVKIVGDSKWD